MAFTAADTSLRDKEYLKFVGAPTGSQMYVAVSIQSGLAITIGSVSANVDSVYIQSGANIDLGSAWTNIGSVLISNGSLNVWGSTGGYAGSDVYIRAGSVQTYNPIGVGSVTGQVTIGAGSIQPYNPIGIGSVRIAEWGAFGSVLVTGSVNVAGFTGSIVTYPGQTPLAIKPSSNTTVGSTYLTSGTANLLWSPTAGSKFVITDLIMSTDTAMYVRLFESGNTLDFVRGYFAANGGMVSNFNTGIKGANAGSQVYVGQSANGSLFITITGYSEA